METVDLLVIGAGLPGLRAALQRRRAAPDARVLVVDAAPWPGGSVRSQRSNGFVCELGPFGFRDDELAPHLGLLSRPPRVVPPLAAAQHGWLFDGTGLQRVDVQEAPRSFATGCEELVQAYRRELDGALRLGRAAVELQPFGAGQHSGELDGLHCTLGGEAQTTIAADEVTLAVGPADAARLLQAFDPTLARLADDVVRTPRAFVFLGGVAKHAPELRGYGVVPADDVASPVAEAIFCTEVFPQRALDGRCLVRVEVDAGALDDDALAELARAELRRWTGTAAEFGFVKVHRFDVVVDDGALTECRVRLGEVAARVGRVALDA